MCETKFQQDFIAKKKQNKGMMKNVPKINVQQIKGKGKFYFYLYSLGT
jgi:hypothetical protein